MHSSIQLGMFLKQATFSTLYPGDDNAINKNPSQCLVNVNVNVVCLPTEY